MMTRRHWKIVINVGLAGLMFELVAFSDFDGAHANDLNMLESVSGSTSSGKFPPPNIVFIFDTSGSMNNLICEDFDDTNGNYECDDGQNTQRSGPNGSTICYNQVFDALTGPDRDQDGTADSYVGLFDPADGVTWQRYSIYPIFDERDTSVTTDDTIIPWTTWTHGDNDPWDLRETGTGSTDWEKLEDVINDHCDNFADCNQRSRCIYSLRTQGYFYESGCSPSGDPMDMCSVPQGTGLGRYCDEDTDCAGTWECRTDGGEYVCSTCDFDSDCTGTCITSAGCAHAHCSESSCSVTIASMGAVGDACTDHEDCFYDLDCVSGQCTGGSLGAALGGACSSDSDCSGTYVCNSTVCSNCLADSDCTGSTNLCVNTGCSHHYCSETGACRPGSHQSFPGSAGGTARNHAFLGDFLNFYPPKSYTLVKAFRDTVENMGGDARIGVARFDGSVGATVSYNIAGDCTAALTDDCLDVTTSTTCFDPMDSTLRSWLFGLSFGGQTPLAEALDDIGAYYANNPSGTANDTICDYSTISGLCEDGNVPNNVVLISDGLPSSDATDSTHVPFSTAGLNALTPSETMSNGYNETDSYGGQQNWVDDVAKALQNIDVRSDLDGDQFIDTYTVSFGLLDGNDCHGVMEKAAVAGGGQCFPAKSVDQLRSALSEIIVQINKKIHGFAAPATSATRRTDSTSLSAALFRPSVDFPLWEGHIFGLQVCDENVAGATCTCPVAGDDVCVVDANGDAVAYDVEGYMTSEPFWDAQLCLSKDPANPPPAGLGPDQAGVDTTNCFVSPANRNIYTVVDSDADGELSDETKIDFSVANVTSNAAFLTALNVGGVIADGEEVVKFFRG